MLPICPSMSSQQKVQFNLIMMLAILKLISLKALAQVSATIPIPAHVWHLSAICLPLPNLVMWCVPLIQQLLKSFYCQFSGLFQSRLPNQLICDQLQMWGSTSYHGMILIDSFFAQVFKHEERGAVTEVRRLHSSSPQTLLSRSTLFQHHSAASSSSSNNKRRLFVAASDEDKRQVRSLFPICLSISFLYSFRHHSNSASGDRNDDFSVAVAMVRIWHCLSIIYLAMICSIYLF